MHTRRFIKDHLQYKSDSISRLKTIIFRLSSPLVRPFLTFCIRMTGCQRYRFGRCSYWGQPQDIRIFQDAVTQLAQLDAHLHQKILNGDALVFWYHKTDLRDERFTMTFSITDNYLAWKQDGIIVRLVYSHFLTEDLGRTVYPRLDSLRRHNELRLKTLKWLWLHNLPEGLQKPFKQRAHF